MIDFFQTVRGIHFAETITRQLPNLVKELKRQNDLKELELKLKQQESFNEGEHKNDDE